MIGTLGSRIIFEVSEERVLTFTNMTREVSGRWAEHEALGTKPKPEFLGPGLSTGSLEILLSATLGVRPRSILDAVADMVESGTAEYLIVGNRLVGYNPYRLMSASEAWETIYSRGELVRARLTLTLGEYT